MIWPRRRQASGGKHVNQPIVKTGQAVGLGIGPGTFGEVQQQLREAVRDAGDVLDFWRRRANKVGEVLVGVGVTHQGWDRHLVIHFAKEVRVAGVVFLVHVGGIGGVAVRPSTIGSPRKVRISSRTLPQWCNR